MLTLMEAHLSSERPLLLISWSSLCAFEDLADFSALTGFPSEQLIQSLLYRLRRCVLSGDNDRGQEDVKVGKSSNDHV